MDTSFNVDYGTVYLLEYEDKKDMDLCGIVGIFTTPEEVLGCIRSEETDGDNNVYYHVKRYTLDNPYHYTRINIGDL